MRRAIARIAEDCGIAALAIHGRTRADQYRVRPNTTPSRWSSRGEHSGDRQRRHQHARKKRKYVLDCHRGRRRDDRPRGPGPALDVSRDRALSHNRRRSCRRREVREIPRILRDHLADLYAFYGEDTGVKIARKHISWLPRACVGAAAFRHAMNQLRLSDEQLAATDEFFELGRSDRLTRLYDPRSQEASYSSEAIAA